MKGMSRNVECDVVDTLAMEEILKRETGYQMRGQIWNVVQTEVLCSLWV